jgi:hypothetical protein
VNLSEEVRKEIEAFPPVLRTLLNAELASGNEIVELGHSFPAPPVGAYVRLARPVTTRRRESEGELSFYDRNSSIYSGEFTDAKRSFFVLEPPHPREPEPDMDAIRRRLAPGSPTSIQPPPKLEASPVALAAEPRSGSALEQFKRSMIIDYEQWHDGIGYDLEVLRGASRKELAAIEALLISHDVNDWRDVEALAALGTPRARKALKAAFRSKDHELRLAVADYAPELVPKTERIASLVKALEHADLSSGLSQALDQVEDFHPAAVVEALFRGALRRDGEVAVLFAAMLMFVHGKAKEPFEWEQRPFFLKFHTENRAERVAAFRELCEKIGVNATTYLAAKPRRRA